MGELEIGGRTIAPGTLVMTHLAGANRDPAKWGPTVDQVDVGRADASQHVSFGSGIHFCLGAALARLEAQVAMGSILRRFPGPRAGRPPPSPTAASPSAAWTPSSSSGSDQAASRVLQLGQAGA